MSFISYRAVKWKFNEVFSWSAALQTFFPLSSNVLQALAMGASKSKPRDEGKRTRSLEGNLSSGGGAGSHHLNSTQQSLTPNRSPTMDSGLIGNQSVGNKAELTLFGGVDSNNVTSSNIATLAGENLSSSP